MNKNKKKKIAIIFCVKQWDVYYSLVHVVKSQIRVLVSNGYKPRILLLQGCSFGEQKRNVDYRACIPYFSSQKRNLAQRVFFAQVGKVEKALEKNLRGIDIVFTHDLMYLLSYARENIAIRRVAKKMRHMRWLHWMHSCPYSPEKKRRYPYNTLWTDMPNAKFVCVNKSYRKDFALMYKIPIQKIATVYNPRSLLDFMDMDILTSKIIAKGDLLNADIVAMMPWNLNRPQKQLEIGIYIMAALKAYGRSVRLVFATPLEKKKDYFYFMRLRWLADKVGLSEKEVIFTYEVDTRLRKGCPEKVIRGIFQVSNLFIHPSLHEGCSMALLEAAITRNLCVLNKDVPGLKELANANAVWIKCYDVRREIMRLYGRTAVSYEYFYRYYVDKKGHYKRCALKILDSLSKSKTLSLFTKIKKEFNEQAIFGKQLKPLIDE